MRAHGETARPQTWQARCPGMGHHDTPSCSPPRCAAPWHGTPRHGTARRRRGMACGPMVARHGPKLGRLGAMALGITTHHCAARHDVLHHGMPWHGAAAAWHGVAAPRLGMRAHGETERPQTWQARCHGLGHHDAPWCSLNRQAAPWHGGGTARHGTARHGTARHGTAAPRLGMRAHGGTAWPQTLQARCHGPGHHDTPLCSLSRCGHDTACHGTARRRHGTAVPWLGMRAHGATERPQTWQTRCHGLGHHDAPWCSPPRCAAPWHGSPWHGGTARRSAAAWHAGTRRDGTAPNLAG
jgi:hypothetical protein